MSLSISLSTDGNDIFITSSRELKVYEYPYLLRCGVGINRYKKYRRRNKWCLYRNGKFDPIFERESGKFSTRSLCKWYACKVGRSNAVRINKTSRSKFYMKLEKGRTKKVCYGIGVYEGGKRVSNICYFRSNVKATSDSTFEQWLSV